MRNFLSVILIFVLISCGTNSKPGQEDKRWIMSQLNDRLKYSDGLGMGAEFRHIDEEVNRFVLLSKDIENSTAAVKLSNDFFYGLTNSRKLDSGAIHRLDPTMNTETVEMFLRRNQLSVYNQLLMQNDSTHTLIFTAQ